MANTFHLYSSHPLNITQLRQNSPQLGHSVLMNSHLFNFLLIIKFIIAQARKGRPLTNLLMYTVLRFNKMVPEIFALLQIKICSWHYKIKRFTWSCFKWT